MSKQLSIKDKFLSSARLSWLQHLLQDPEAIHHTPNKSSREVKSGHYVPVDPTPLPLPVLVAVSPDVCNLIGLPAEYCRTSEDFTRYFSGDMSGYRPSPSTSTSASTSTSESEPLSGVFQSWCTPYALSIFGNEFYDNCPFKNGNGYGDGRAISVGEVVTPGVSDEEGAPRRWEMQLKGAGRTPFCRGGDGKSVLRYVVCGDMAVCLVLCTVMTWLI